MLRFLQLNTVTALGKLIYESDEIYKLPQVKLRLIKEHHTVHI